MDFSKAFDKVDHEKLLSKLSSLGISDSLHLWIRSFLSGREQTVVVDGSSSTPAPVLSGVPQGSVLGPLLFLAYINDINKHLSEGTKIRLFADDSLLYRIIRTEEDSATLQKDLDTLQAWEIENKMEFHHATTNVRCCELPTNTLQSMSTTFTAFYCPFSPQQNILLFT